MKIPLLRNIKISYILSQTQYVIILHKYCVDDERCQFSLIVNKSDI